MERKESNLEVAREEKTRSVAEKKIGGVRVPFGVASRVLVVMVVVVSDRAFPTREILSRDTSVPRFNFLRGLISPLIHLTSPSPSDPTPPKNEEIRNSSAPLPPITSLSLSALALCGPGPSLKERV